MLFVYNCNPVATMPNQNRVIEGLSREDLFTVVFEQVMTDTAKFADVILPATTFLESYDVAQSYGSTNLQLARPVIEPVGAARPNVEVFAELAERLGSGRGRGGGRATSRPCSSSPLALPEEARGGLMGRGDRRRGGGGRAGPSSSTCIPRTRNHKVRLFPEELERESPGGHLPLPARTPRDPATIRSP